MNLSKWLAISAAFLQLNALLGVPMELVGALLALAAAMTDVKALSSARKNKRAN